MLTGLYLIDACILSIIELSVIRSRALHMLNLVMIKRYPSLETLEENYALCKGARALPR